MAHVQQLCAPGPAPPFQRESCAQSFLPLGIFASRWRRIQTHWKEWYPEMAEPEKPVKDLVRGPALGPKFSASGPIPSRMTPFKPRRTTTSFSSKTARFACSKSSFVPAKQRPCMGIRIPRCWCSTPMSGNPPRSPKPLDPPSPLNGQGAGHAGPPKTHNLNATHMRDYGAPGASLHPQRRRRSRCTTIASSTSASTATAWWPIGEKWYPWMQYMQFMRERP